MYSSERFPDSLQPATELNNQLATLQKSRSLASHQDKIIKSAHHSSHRTLPAAKSFVSPYSLEDVIRMKDHMIAYLKNEKEKLEDEIKNGPQQSLSLPKPAKTASSRFLTISVPQMVLISLLALMLGFIAGSR